MLDVANLLEHDKEMTLEKHIPAMKGKFTITKGVFGDATKLFIAFYNPYGRKSSTVMFIPTTKDPIDIPGSK